MTYALIANKMATLMAIMIKKNFPIALLPQTPTQSSRNSCGRGELTRVGEGPAIEAGPSEVKV
jgi:hypothetical protein